MISGKRGGVHSVFLRNFRSYEGIYKGVAGIVPTGKVEKHTLYTQTVNR